MMLRLGSILFLCGLAACGDDAQPAAGVIHLDLRLGDGTSAAVALAQALPAREIHLSGESADDRISLGPWSVVGGRLVRANDGTRLDAIGDETPVLRLPGPLKAAEFPHIELVLETRKPTHAVVSWSGSEGDGRLALELHPGDEPRRLTFAVATDKTWAGTLDELVVSPSLDGGTPVVVHSIRLVPTGFRWGDEPLGDERVAGRGGAAGDAGLRRRGFESRRAWPSDLHVPLFDEVSEVPSGGTLSVAVALGNRALGTHEKPLIAVVDGRVPGGAWRRLAELALPGDRSAQATSWNSLTADLGAFAGGALELRFLASRGDIADADDVPADAESPREEHVLWGAPEVVGNPPASRRPNLVLVTLDTTRADALGGEFTPFLNRFGEDAVVFADAWSACNATTASHASIMTGMHVEEHGAITNRHLLSAEVQTVAEILRRAGYHTAATVSVPHIQAGVGFGQGFDTFALAQPGAELNGAFAVRWAERWIEEWESLPDRPFFLWVHLFDPHTPYGPPDEFTAEFLASSELAPPDKTSTPATIPVYDAPRDPARIPVEKRWLAGVSSIEYSRFVYALGVAYADHLCERLHAALDGAGFIDDAAVVVVADHGESLGEHNVWFTHAGLFRETLQVPLILRLPNGPRGERVDTPVSSIDIAPTLLRLGAAPIPDHLSGHDLVATLDGTAPKERQIWFAFNALHQIGYRDPETHFVTTFTDDLYYGTELVEREGKVVPVQGPDILFGQSFLYDPRADPALIRDLAGERPLDVENSLLELERWRAGLQAARVERRNLSEAEEADLEGLGYTGD